MDSSAEGRSAPPELEEQRFQASRFEPPIRAFVQGATGGIGRELVRVLLQSSSVGELYASCRNPARARELFASENGTETRLRLVELDVTDEKSLRRAAETVAEGTDRLDLIVNASGLLHGTGLQPEKRLTRLELPSLQRSFAVNAYGPVLVAKHLSRFLPRQEPSVFASLSARVGSIGDNRLGGWYSYRASKAALNMLHRTLAIELARTHPGCACVLLHPGTVDTSLSQPFQSGVPRDRLFSPRRAAAQLLSVIDGLKAGDTGRFFAWDGQEIPW